MAKKRLMIVESPAKTRTLKHFLGDDFKVVASMGHVRDLPRGTLGVDLDKDFKPTYRVLTDRKETLEKIGKDAKGAAEVFLATDPDREGEAIAWHVAEVLKLSEPRRVEFNEITRSAVQRALENPRTIDMKRVDAQQARRILDRLVGYNLSPFLWRRLGNTSLSAGRVQSVAVKMVCDREREILAFVPQEYWNIWAFLSAQEGGEQFRARLVRKDGEKVRIENGRDALAVLENLRGLDYRVKDYRKKTEARHPPAPFITSTLQRDASSRLGFGTRKTMIVAQQLYEGVRIGAGGTAGLITYMRTDSTRVSQEALGQVREYIVEHFGSDHLPAKPWFYPSPRGAQEAHEAIRPTDVSHHPDQIQQYLDPDQAKLYRLIWSRFVASQMAAAQDEVRTAEVEAGPYVFGARTTHQVFDGFRRVYLLSGELNDKPLPLLGVGQMLNLEDYCQEQKFTEPPPHYTEATLIRALEAKGIGRPSTYAPIMATIVKRGYVDRRRRVLYATPLGFGATDDLVGHFPEIINEQFTAAMEDRLDAVEQGRENWVQVVRDFYDPLQALMAKATAATCPKCGKGMVIKTGRFGHFLACKGYPECDHTERLVQAETTDQVCDKCGKPMVVRAGKRGKFLACTGYPECRNTKQLEEPQRAEQGDDAQAIQGTCEKCGKPMAVRSGRFGKFLACTGYPECRNTRRVTAKGSAPAPQEAGACPKCGKPLVVRTSKRGQFLGCSGYPKCRHIAPLTAALPQNPSSPLDGALQDPDGTLQGPRGRG
jgi:DNA topoisomerase-1